MATDGVLASKTNAIMGSEAVAGVWNEPTPADKNFPIGVDIVNIDPRMSEGFEDANGKDSPSRQFSNGFIANLNISSYLMEPVNPAVADGELEISPLFQQGGFRLDSSDTNFKLIWDGNGTCNTGSIRVLNKECGNGSTGTGTDIRGMRNNITITAESAGSPFMVTAEAMGAVEGEIDVSKSVIAEEYSNDAGTQPIEMFVGSLELDSVSLPVDAFTLNMNTENVEQKDPSANKGVGHIYTNTSKPTIELKAPIGTATGNWWTNLEDGKVYSTLVYTGLHYDITMTDLVVSSVAREADSKIKLTQVLKPTTITIDPK